MHVVVDVRTITPRFPGIGRYVRGLIESLDRSVQTEARLTVLRTQDVALRSDVASCEISGGPFSPRQQWSVPRALRGLKADVYHCPYYLMPYRPGVPTVLTVYDLIPMRLPGLCSARTRFLFPRLMRAALAAADHVTTISESSRRDLVEMLGVPADAITVVTPSIDTRFRPRPPDDVDRVRRAYGLPAHYVLYLGTNRPHKNLVRLVEAWSMGRPQRDASWRLVIAGGWDPRFPHAIRRARELRLEQEIVFAGPIEDVDLPALYSGAGLFVFPSLYEGFGLPVLEALACGVPVACSSSSSLPEVAGPDAAYFDPYDVDMMADVINQLMRDRERRDEMRPESIRRAASFSSRHSAASLMNAYRSLYMRASRVAA